MTLEFHSKSKTKTCVVLKLAHSDILSYFLFCSICLLVLMLMLVLVPVLMLVLMLMPVLVLMVAVPMLMEELVAADSHRGDQSHELLEITVGVSILVQVVHQAVQRGLVCDVPHEVRQLIMQQLLQFTLLQLVPVSFPL